MGEMHPERGGARGEREVPAGRAGGKEKSWRVASGDAAYRCVCVPMVLVPCFFAEKRRTLLDESMRKKSNIRNQPRRLGMFHAAPSREGQSAARLAAAAVAAALIVVLCVTSRLKAPSSMTEAASFRVVCVSDTHGRHDRASLLRVPDGDMLLFAGDAGLETQVGVARRSIRSFFSYCVAWTFIIGGRLPGCHRHPQPNPLRSVPRARAAAACLDSGTSTTSTSGSAGCRTATRSSPLATWTAGLRGPPPLPVAAPRPRAASARDC